MLTFYKTFYISSMLNKTALFLFLVFFSFACQQNTKKSVDKTSVEITEEPVESIPTETFQNDQPPHHISDLPIPKLVVFAGDTVPLEKNYVREALEFELGVNVFRHSRTVNAIKQFKRWDKFISEILKENGVPRDFIYLAVIESELDNTAHSGAGAMGMWQIMEPTAKEYGLEVNRDRDMRRDPKEATIAAAKYLKWAYKELNNWTLAAASYNRGKYGVEQALEEQQVDNFYDLHLNPETSRYVYRILAMKLILENENAYGYFFDRKAMYEPLEFKTIYIKDDIKNLVDFAKENNTTYKELRLLNPWFNNTSNYKLHVPRKDSIALRLPISSILKEEDVK